MKNRTSCRRGQPSGIAILYGLLLALLLAPAWADGVKPSRTVLSDVPWSPGPGGGAKVVYGTDDRLDVYEVSDPAVLQAAASTCALVTESRVVNNGDGTYSVSASEFLQFGLSACEEEPYGDQPVLASCSGFVLGPDLIGTAGHCFNTIDLGSTYFLFGFAMVDANTPILTFNEDQVYRGIELVGRELSGIYDYSVVRVDRNIIAPGAVPFDIRREGEIAIGENIGVLGHPSGLPSKVAYGSETAVRTNDSDGFFVANLDTYHGNSGSPVVNAATGVLEGILVRGETDYVSMGDCFVSNVVPNDSGRGEDVSKTTSFMQFVPEFITSAGRVVLDHLLYNCSDTLQVDVRDADLIGAETVTVSLFTASGDNESLVLAEAPGANGVFTGQMAIIVGTPVTDDGTLQVIEADTVVVNYLDMDDGTGSTALATDSASIDCSPPVISSVTVTDVSGSRATVAFGTDELASVEVRYGLDCDDLSGTASDLRGENHVVALTGLLPTSTYYFAVQASDEAGNEAIDDNGGACYSLTTTQRQDYFTQIFSETEGPILLNGLALSLVPADNSSHYELCTETVNAFPVDPQTAATVSVADDDFQEITLTGEHEIPYFGETFNSFFIGSNGYVTFRFGDDTFTHTLTNHFAIPRISMLFTDLNPVRSGRVSAMELEDRAVVTFEAIPEYDPTGEYLPTNSNNFQLELFYDGQLRLTYLGVSALECLAGISEGTGLPVDIIESDFNMYVDCAAMPFHTADQNMDWMISLSEALRIVQFYNSGGFHCAEGTEDGYAPRTGAQICSPHDSDYNPADWNVDLSELLRLIQFYSADGYERDASGEDGFVPVFSP